MRDLVSALEQESQQVAMPMAPPARKAMYFASYASARTRNIDGTALRRKP